MASKRTVKEYMRSVLKEYTSPWTGEVNTTLLAEDACNEFNGYGPAPEYDIPEEYFEWAFEVDEAEGG